MQGIVFVPGISGSELRQEIQFRGRLARSLPSILVAPKTPGIYRLDFGAVDATHRTSGQVAGWFAVSAKS